MADLRNPAHAVCIWFPEHGQHLVAGQDLERLTALCPNGKVFRCVETGGDYLRIFYGESSFLVMRDVLKPVPAPRFRIGQAVMAKEKKGVVIDVLWHHRDAVPFYFLAIQGKRISRRYFEDELEAVG